MAYIDERETFYIKRPNYEKAVEEIDKALELPADQQRLLDMLPVGEMKFVKGGRSIQHTLKMLEQRGLIEARYHKNSTTVTRLK